MGSRAAFLIFAIALPLQTSAQPHAHGQDGIPDWYDASCCNLKDCRPVEDATISFEMTEFAGPALIWTTQAFGKEVRLTYTKEKWRTSKDGRYHTCSNSFPLCVYLPPGA